MSTPVLSADQQLNAVKTWRYLRVAIVAVLVGLGVSVGYERLHTHPGCFQTSISEYYYTPVQAVLVGALISIGVSMYCLKGQSDIEDVLLNLAGILAPVVALVPTPDTGTCATVLATTRDRNVNVGNNVFALLTVGALALIFVALLVLRSPGGVPGRTHRLGYLATLLIWLTGTLTFGLARGLFLSMAHYTAAVTMFVFIIGVVLLNALRYRDRCQAPSLRNRYSVIAVLMVLAVLIIGGSALLGWDYAVITLESALIVLFAAFWVVQTHELWQQPPAGT